jgi:hypothetical protein
MSIDFNFNTRKGVIKEISRLAGEIKYFSILLEELWIDS